MRLVLSLCPANSRLASARIPCVAASDKEAIQMCIRTCNGIAPSGARVI